jgi:hypothetical protein
MADADAVDVGDGVVRAGRADARGNAQVARPGAVLRCGGGHSHPDDRGKHTETHLDLIIGALFTLSQFCP